MFFLNIALVFGTSLPHHPSSILSFTLPLTTTTSSLLLKEKAFGFFLFQWVFINIFYLLDGSLNIINPFFRFNLFLVILRLVQCSFIFIISFLMMKAFF